MYICWQEYKNCVVGNQYQAINGYIVNESGEQLCAEHSQDAHYHFSINDDGHGLERGAIAYKIANAPRKRTWTEQREDPETGEIETITVTGRFTPEEDTWLTTNYPQHRDNGAFNEAWFVAPIEDVRAINEYLGDNGWL